MTSCEAASILKRELRKRIRTALTALPENFVQQQSAATTARFVASAAYQNARCIALYAAMPREFDTQMLIADAFTRSKRVFLPRVVSKKRHEMIMLECTSIAELMSWAPNDWGIREPPLDEARPQAPRDAALDVIVVPGVAFDASGARCGHGMGFYDRFLTTYKGCGRPMPHLAALALTPQVVESVPMTPDDWSMDEVLCADET